jgi:hypothetical protein
MKRLATAACLNLGLILALIPAAALAKDKKAGDPPPAVFQAVIDCRGIADSGARLACYDAKVATLADAQKSDDLFVASKAQVREARRGLFGLSLPRITIFGGDDDDPEDKLQIKEIDAVLSGVGGGTGRWVLTLDDGATWIQTDGAFIKTPKPGAKVHIKRGALGSYMANVNGGLGFKVKRENR